MADRNTILYQPLSSNVRQALSKAFVFYMLVSSAFLLAGCAAPQVQQEAISVTILVDGVSQSLSVQPGTTARQVLESSGVQFGALDRSAPPLFTVLEDGSEVRLIRVTEEFSIEEIVVPFETQLLRNESLPEGERRLIQPGANGLQENTFRKVYEMGEEISSSLVKTIIVNEPQPEIIMIGSQAAYVSVDIPGMLAYISGGNAWVMDGNTGIRRPVVTTGDLDGYVFSLSPDLKWLLFTRSDSEENIINTLWVARVDGEEEALIDLDVQNIIHFADWVPDSTNAVIFSTVEYSATSPGWQANNDLKFVNFSDNGWASPHRTAIEANSGGKYGWWGLNFAWSPDGEQLAYAAPDALGIVDFEKDELSPLLEVTSLVTRSSWVWVPSLGWSPDSDFIFTVDHAPQEGVPSPEESMLFDLIAVPAGGGAALSIVPQVGMFAVPVPSALQENVTDERAYQVIYLQALLTLQSDTSDYQLVVMDRDGSNRTVLYPAEGAPGLQPQSIFWAMDDSGTLAFVYQGNLWFFDLNTGEAQQLTGDGLVSTIDWK